MPSKFAAILPKLKRMPEALRNDEPGFWDKVAKARLAIKVKKASAIAVRYAALRKEQEEVAQRAKELNVLVTAHEEELEKAYQNEKLESLNIKGVGTVRYAPEPYTKITNPSELKEWLRQDPNYAVKLQEVEDRAMISWMTINSIAKERLLAMEPEPAGVEVFFRPKFVFTKVK